MSKIGITLKIDVTKIEKARLFKGKKGTYLDATVFVDLDELDEFGNSGMITQDVTKEEKDAGTKGAILGNAKVFWKAKREPTQQEKNNKPNPKGKDFDDMNFDDDLPF